MQEVAATPQDAASFVSTSLTPDVGPLPPLDTTNRFQTWPLAYRAVILLCSHKRRDKRCHIIAPLLRAEFGRVLDSEGIEVDARGDEAEHGPEPCMEEWDDEDREARYERARRRAASSNAVGIFNVRSPLVFTWSKLTSREQVSHIGGHR